MRYFVLLFCVIIIGCSSRKKDCSDFRTGTFRYADVDSANWIITRNDSLQIETEKTTNVKMTAKIEWLSDCNYVLTYQEIINSPDNGLIGKQFKVDIIETSKNKYKFNVYTGFEKAVGTLIRVH